MIIGSSGHAHHLRGIEIPLQLGYEGSPTSAGKLTERERF